MFHAARRVALVLVAALLLSGCFTSQSLLKEQRVWDPTWQGRYQNSEGDYVVLAADADRRLYLVGEINREKNEFKALRAALYPGWDDLFILATQDASSRATVNYHVVRRIGQSVEVVAPKCEAKSERQNEDPCSFSSIDALRKAIKPAYGAEAEKAKVDRVPASPPSTIAFATETATFEDSEGVRGALRITAQKALPAGMKAGELIVAVNGNEATSAAELVVWIAFERPGTQVRLRLLDPATHTERDVSVATRPVA